MLWWYAGSPAATERELHFADANKASDWAEEALRWATEQGIINGKEGEIFHPTLFVARYIVSGWAMEQNNERYLMPRIQVGSAAFLHGGTPLLVLTLNNEKFGD